MPGSETVCANLTIWENGVKGACYSEMAKYAMMSEIYAKQNRKWIDRTGRARAGLFGSCQMEGSKIISSVSHTMDYGVHLELRPDYMGRYKILEEAITHDISGLMARIRAIVAGAGISNVFASFQAGTVPGTASATSWGVNIGME